MRIFIFLIFLVFPTLLFSQTNNESDSNLNSKYQRESDTTKKQKIAPIDLYRVITMDRDTT